MSDTCDHVFPPTEIPPQWACDACVAEHHVALCFPKHPHHPLGKSHRESLSKIRLFFTITKDLSTDLASLIFGFMEMSPHEIALAEEIDLFARFGHGPLLLPPPHYYDIEMTPPLPPPPELDVNRHLLGDWRFVGYNARPLLDRAPSPTPAEKRGKRGGRRRARVA